MSSDLRLFVWTGFCPDYTDGLAFAIAGSLEEAQAIIMDKMGTEPYQWGTLEVLSLDRATGFYVYGGS